MSELKEEMDDARAVYEDLEDTARDADLAARDAFNNYLKKRDAYDESIKIEGEN